MDQWQSLYFGFRITVTWVDVAKTWSKKKIVYLKLIVSVLTEKLL